MHLGLIGYGNIARGVLAALPDGVSRLTLVARVGRMEAIRSGLEGIGLPFEVVESGSELLDARPDLVVECAGHEAVTESVILLLGNGIDCVVVSVGALSDPGVKAALRHAAERGGARVILPAGAIGGIDLVSALSAAGGLEVRYTGTKPPAAWAGTPAETAVDLDGLTGAAVFFKGTAREAARLYPKNANVAATLALAGAGFEDTHVTLVADPAAGGNLHCYDIRSPLAEVSVRIENLPSADNPKTSAATIYSVLREIRNRIGPMVI